MKLQKFKAGIELIGINPFVSVPDEILKGLCLQSGKAKGPIPVCGSVNRKPYKQTLVKYKGDKALKANKEAKKTFDSLPPSRRKEIVRYISALKTPESVRKNIQRAISHLMGNNAFAGREKP